MKWRSFQMIQSLYQILSNNNKAVKFIALMACFNLSGCFLASRLKIKTALYTKNCSKLSNDFIYDLSRKEIEESLSFCLQKKEYSSVLSLLSYLEAKNLSTEEKISIWRQKAEIYQKHLSLYSEASLEWKKVLEDRPADFSALQGLMKTQIKKELFDTALKTADLLLRESKLNGQKKLEIQFTKARLLVLTQKRKQALALFMEIRSTNPLFFDKMQGTFYTALLMEEEGRFEEAMEEVKTIRWPFSEGKSKHWQYRKENTVKSR